MFLSFRSFSVAQHYDLLLFTTLDADADELYERSDPNIGMAVAFILFSIFFPEKPE